MNTNGTRYYVATQNNVLLRHQPDGTDESYGSALHAWTSTNRIMAYMAGEDDDVEEITEAQARKLAPKAFSG